jgi:hypothetical protein
VLLALLICGGVGCECVVRVRFVRLRLLVSVTTAVLLLCDVEAVVIILWCDVGVLTTISRVGVMLVGFVGFWICVSFCAVFFCSCLACVSGVVIQPAVTTAPSQLPPTTTNVDPTPRPPRCRSAKKGPKARRGSIAPSLNALGVCAGGVGVGVSGARVKSGICGGVVGRVRVA